MVDSDAALVQGRPASLSADVAPPNAFHALFEDGPIPMWVFDLESLAIIEVNRAAMMHYGWSREEFLAMTIRDIRPRDEVPTQLGRMPPADRLRRRGVYRHRKRDGTIIDVDVSVQDVVLRGKRARLVVAIDVTEQVRAGERQRFVADVSTVLARTLDYERTLSSIAGLAIDHLADGCTVHVPTADGGLSLLALESRDPRKAAVLREIDRHTPYDPSTPVGPLAVLRSGEPQLFRHITEEALTAHIPDSALREAWRALELCSAMCIPIATSSRMIGVVTLGSYTRGRHFDQRDLQLAQELARYAAFAIENAELYATAQRARAAAERAATRTARLQSVTAALADTWRPTEVASIVVGEGIAALGARAGSVGLVSEDGQAIEVVQATGYPPEVRDRFRRLPLQARFPLSDAVREARAIFLRDAAERDGRYPHRAGLHRRDAGGPMAAVPLLVDGRAVGVLGLEFGDDHDLEDDDRAFILTLARQCTQAMERTRLHEAERRARAVIEAARLEAEAANRTKTQFLAVMSHELRTPLNAIAGYAELLSMGLRGPVTASQLEDLSRIRRSQQHLLRLIDDVLNFAKLETGTVRYCIADVPVADVLASLEAITGPQVSAKRLLYVPACASPEIVARVDRDKLQQILVNLVGNAVKFTEPGGRIMVVCDGADDRVLIAVHDTGSGIPLERQEVIFEPFVQLEQGLTRTVEGTGLGLAISRDLARAMGGDLTVESEPGIGSVFTVSVPRGGRE
ncbi:MAG TPA: GAF domain-containing protein [Gemmatimonadaceae bacterium]|nr:GAF domain-containing protein [Gemmatimonadaceae bacterium]